MPFLLVDDNFPDHPKLVGLTDGAFRLHVAALCYCARNLTNGRIPRGDVARLTRTYRPKFLPELVEAGLWADLEDVEVHDYLDWNPSADEVKERRGQTADRKRRWRERNGSQNASGNASRNVSRDAPLSHPTPKGLGVGDSSSSRVPPSPRPSDGDGSPDTSIDEETRVRNVERIRAARLSVKAMP